MTWWMIVAIIVMKNIVVSIKNGEILCKKRKLFFRYL